MCSISLAFVKKSFKVDTVSMGILMKICKALMCSIEDIINFISVEEIYNEQ